MRIVVRATVLRRWGQAVSACNDCWDEAFRRSQIGGGHQAEHYEVILRLPPSERPWCAFAQSLTTETEEKA